MGAMNFASAAASVVAAAEPANGANTTNLGLVLGVALLTWAGVWFYLLRLERMTRVLEREVEAARSEMQN